MSYLNKNSWGQESLVFILLVEKWNVWNHCVRSEWKAWTGHVTKYFKKKSHRTANISNNITKLTLCYAEQFIPSFCFWHKHAASLGCRAPAPLTRTPENHCQQLDKDLTLLSYNKHKSGLKFVFKNAFFTKLVFFCSASSKHCWFRWADERDKLTTLNHSAHFLCLCLSLFFKSGQILRKIKERVRDLRLQNHKEFLLTLTASGHQPLQHVKEAQVHQKLNHFNRQDGSTFPQVQSNVLYSNARTRVLILWSVFAAQLMSIKCD